MMSDVQTPRITIGITCYNAEDSIERAIESARAQTWPSVDILIVDDASTDESVTRIQRAIEGDARCALIVHDKNKGVAGARNTLMNAAQGLFIAFFDDDDMSDPRRLEKQYLRLAMYEKENGASQVVCFTGVRRHYPNGYAPVFQAIGSKEKIPKGHDLVAYHLYLDRDPAVFYGNGTPCLTFMARVETLRAVGGFDEKLRRNEDGEFCIRLGLCGGHAIGCPDILVEQAASGGHDKRPEISLESDLYIIEKYRDLLIKEGRYDEAKLWSRMKYAHHAGKKLSAALLLAKFIFKHPVRAIKRIFLRVPTRLLHEWKFSRLARVAKTS